MNAISLPAYSYGPSTQCVTLNQGLLWDFQVSCSPGFEVGLVDHENPFSIACHVWLNRPCKLPWSLRPSSSSIKWHETISAFSTNERFEMFIVTGPQDLMWSFPEFIKNWYDFKENKNLTSTFPQSTARKHQSIKIQLQKHIYQLPNMWSLIHLKETETLICSFWQPQKVPAFIQISAACVTFIHELPKCPHHLLFTALILVLGLEENFADLNNIKIELKLWFKGSQILSKGRLKLYSTQPTTKRKWKYSHMWQW